MTDGMIRTYYLDLIAGRMSRGMDKEIAAMLDECLPGWTMETVLQRLSITHRGRQVVLSVDFEPKLIIHPAEFSHKYDGLQWVQLITQKFERVP